MSSPRSAAPFDLEPRFSRRLFWSAILAHSGAIVCAILLDAIPVWTRLLLVSAMLLSLWHTAHQQGWLQQTAAIRRATWQANGDWFVETGKGELLEARLLPSSYSHPWLVVLNLRLEGRRLPRSLVLMRDSLDETTFRRLRVRLEVDGCGEKG